MMKTLSEKVRRRKVLYALVIVTAYLFAQSIALPWLVDGFQGGENNAQFLQMYVGMLVGGGRVPGSIMTLGLLPWITSSIIMQFYLQSKPRHKRRIPKEVLDSRQRYTAAVLALVYGVISLQAFDWSGQYALTMKVVTLGVFLAGAAFAAFLAELNKRRGLGGIGLLIVGNLLRATMASAYDLRVDAGHLGFTVAIGVWVVVLVVVMVATERAEFRLPLIRGLVHNDYPRDSYFAIKVNPIGTMPIIYAMVLLYAPAQLFSVLEMPVVRDFFSLQTVQGSVVFVFALVVVTRLVAFYLLNPEEAAEDLQHGNNFIVGVQPGSSTEACIRKCVVCASCVSAVVLAACVGIPLVVGSIVGLDSSVVRIPLNMVILVGVVVPVISELYALSTFARYNAVLFR